MAQVKHNAARLSYGEAAANHLWRQYKQRAKKAELTFGLSKQEFLKMTKQTCFYCGQEPSNIRNLGGNGSYTFNGVDRIDSDLGYETYNVVTCCSRCNRAKGVLTHSQFMFQCKLIVWYQEQQNNKAFEKAFRELENENN